MQELIQPSVLAWSFGLSLILFVGSLIIIPILLTRMRSDYFIDSDNTTIGKPKHCSITRGLALVAKNMIGMVLLLSGLAMIVLPGQGVITILIGLSLLNFPGKRRLELRIVRQRHVLDSVNWIRQRAGRPALLVPDPDTGPEPQS